MDENFKILIVRERPGENVFISKYLPSTPTEKDVRDFADNCHFTDDLKPLMGNFNFNELIDDKVFKVSNSEYTYSFYIKRYENGTWVD